jgi:hypothetical protein
MEEEEGESKQWMAEKDRKKRVLMKVEEGGEIVG